MREKDCSTLLVLRPITMALVALTCAAPALAQRFPSSTPQIGAQRQLTADETERLLELSDLLLDKRCYWVERKVAANKLYEMAHINALPALLACARDGTEEFMVRQMSVIAIGRIESDRVVNYLIELLADREVAGDGRSGTRVALRAITKVGFKFKIPWNGGGGDAVDAALLDLRQLWRTWWKIARGTIELAHDNAREQDPVEVFIFETLNSRGSVGRMREGPYPPLGCRQRGVGRRESRRTRRRGPIFPRQTLRGRRRHSRYNRQYRGEARSAKPAGVLGDSRRGRSDGQ